MLSAKTPAPVHTAARMATTALPSAVELVVAWHWPLPWQRGAIRVVAAVASENPTILYVETQLTQQAWYGSAAEAMVRNLWRLGVVAFMR